MAEMGLWAFIVLAAIIACWDIALHWIDRDKDE